MKRFLVVFEYELLNYLKNKSFVITTLIVAVIAAAVMFIPNVFDMSGMLGTSDSSKENAATEQSQDTDASEDSDENADMMLICDKTGAFTDLTILENSFAGTKWEKASSEEDLKKKVEENENAAGFVVNSMTS